MTVQVSRAIRWRGRLMIVLKWIVIIAALGVSIYVVFYFVGKRWASWEA